MAPFGFRSRRSLIRVRVRVHLRPLESCLRQLDTDYARWGRRRGYGGTAVGLCGAGTMMLPGVHSFIKDYAYNDDDNDDKQQNAPCAPCHRETRTRTRPGPRHSPIFHLLSQVSYSSSPPGVRPIIMLMMLFFENFLHCLPALPPSLSLCLSFSLTVCLLFFMPCFILFYFMAVHFIFSSYSFSFPFLPVGAIKVGSAFVYHRWTWSWSWS